MTTPKTTPFDIQVDQVKHKLDHGEDFLLLDCREVHEVAIGAIDGAVHIPMRETVQRQSEFEEFREKSVVVYCHHGGRSARVAQWLRANGFEHAQNMVGGIDHWSQYIDPAIPRY